MKHIHKQIVDEPKALRDYRTTTPEAIYSGYTDKDPNTQEEGVLKKALAEEQGWICCYCMQSLRKGNITVEHYITQNHHPDSLHDPKTHRDNQLNFLNLLASCNYPDRNCSGERGNKPMKKLDPRNEMTSEHLLSYDLADGNIRSRFGDTEVDDDLTNILKLNSSALKNARKIAFDIALGSLRNKKKLQNRRWSKKYLEAAIAEYRCKWKDSNGNMAYRRFCMAAIYFLEKKKERYL